MSNITKYLELNKEKHIISEMTAFFWLIGDKEFCRNKINILIKSLITLVILLLLIFSGISNFISENKSLVVLIATLFTSAQFYFALSCLALSNSAKVAMTTVLSIVFSIFIAHLAYLDTIDRNIEIIAYITMFTTVFFAWITLAYTAESLKIFFKTFKTNEKLYEESKISYKNFVKRNEIELNTKEKESLKAFFEEDNFSTSAINVIKEKPLYLVERQAKLQENMDILKRKISDSKEDMFKLRELIDDNNKEVFVNDKKELLKIFEFSKKEYLKSISENKTDFIEKKFSNEINIVTS